jgi:hypothetical protein
MRLVFLLLCAVLLSACSMGQFFPNPGASPTSTPAADTRTPTPSSTPIVLTRTFTPTPTLSGQRSPTPEITVTPLPTDTAIPVPQITRTTPTPTIQMKGFVSVSVSPLQIFKSGGCLPSSAKFVAQVTDPIRTGYVQLFVRFKSRQSGNTSKWTSIPMLPVGAGTFTYELTTDQVIGENLFRASWVQYQLVAVTSSGREIGRTGVFGEHLLALECSPETPTP